MRAEMHAHAPQGDRRIPREVNEVFRHSAKLVFGNRAGSRQRKAFRFLPQFPEDGSDDFNITRFNTHRVSVYDPQLGRT